MLPELPECSHWWKCPFTPGEEIERLRGEVELLRHERDALNHEAQNLLCIIERLKAERDALKAELLQQALKWSELADRAALTTAAQAETKVWKKLADANAVDAERYKADYESIIRLMAKWVNIYNREQVERYAAKVGVDPDELIAQTEAAIAARGE